MSERICLDCGDKLLGRSDKKFCSDHCRNSYNNQLNKDVNSIVRNVHALLRRNRKILSELYNSGKRKIHVDALVVSGYNFSFITQQVDSEDGIISRYCFEFGYRELEDNYIELVMNAGIAEI